MVRGMRRRLLAAATSVALAACAPAPPTFPLPMTATDLVLHGTGAALVAFLGQPDASPTVCDPEARGPHLATLDERGVEAFVGALRDGRLPPETFRRCAERLLRTPAAGPLLNRMGTLYRELLKSGTVDRDPTLEGRLDVLDALYAGRPQGTALDPARLRAWSAELEQAVAEHRLGLTGTRHAAELLATFSLERGQWKGAPVDEASLDALQVQGDEALLHRFAARLPDPELRRQALRRIVRIHIAASADPDVREHGREVEDIVMKLGRNPVPLDRFPPTGASIDAAHFPIDRVIVRQNVAAGTAKILGARGSVVPEVSLRGSLHVELTGIPHPVTLCGPTKELSPAPCVDPAALEIGNGLVSADRDGALIFLDDARIPALFPLARSPQLTIPFAIAGKELTVLRLGLFFEKPDDMPFAGGQPLAIDIDAKGEGRLTYTIAGAGFSYAAVIERPLASTFHIESRGAPGPPGFDGPRGMDGMPGFRGTNAICPALPAGNGGPGGPGMWGGPGNPGAAGGRGGDITVRLDCGGTPCDALVEQLKRAIVSVGGPGGPGGRGGDGGRGGKGGLGGGGADCPTRNADGTSTVNSLTSGVNGMDGQDAQRGPAGPPGPPGPPGQVRVQVLP